MQRLLSMLLMSILVLAGCGQKGPLVLPDARTGTPVSRPKTTPATAVPPAARPAPGAVPAPEPPSTVQPTG